MRRSLREDVIAIAAIALGAAISFGLTGTFLARATPHPNVRVEVRRQERPDGGSLRITIPASYRTIAVHTDDVVASSGMVRPGARVDLLLELAVADASGHSARIVVENVPVLGNDRYISKAMNGETETTSTVTLLVTPEQAEQVSMATTDGKLHLVLRSDVCKVSKAGAVPADRVADGANTSCR